jgi:methylmalonyl-CoA/ethylmalonyl-CoA epimerase
VKLKDMTLDHVAIAVADLDIAVKAYEAMGLSFSPEREEVKEQGVMTAFASIDQVAKLELLAPNGSDGPIKSFLEKKGPGIHHLCFRVEDIKHKCQELRQQGFILLYEEPRVGAHEMLVNFIHPKSTGGVLIEINQKPRLG